MVGIQILDFKPDKLHRALPGTNFKCGGLFFATISGSNTCVLFIQQDSHLITPVPLFCSGPLPPSFRPECRPSPFIAPPDRAFFAKHVVVLRNSTLQIACPLLLFPDNRLPCRIPTGNVNHPWDICVLCMSGNTHSFFRLASKNHKKTTPWVADAKLFSKSGFCVKSGAVFKGVRLKTPKAKKKN